MKLALIGVLFAGLIGCAGCAGRGCTVEGSSCYVEESYIDRPPVSPYYQYYDDPYYSSFDYPYYYPPNYQYYDYDWFY